MRVKRQRPLVPPRRQIRFAAREHYFNCDDHDPTPTTTLLTGTRLCTLILACITRLSTVRQDGCPSSPCKQGDRRCAPPPLWGCCSTRTQLTADCKNDKSSKVTIDLVNDSPFHLIGAFDGPEDTPYEGGRFQVVRPPPPHLTRSRSHPSPGELCAAACRGDSELRLRTQPYLRRCVRARFLVQTA